MARHILLPRNAAGLHLGLAQNAGQDGVQPANERVQKLRQHQIQHDNSHETCNKARRGRLPNASGARATIEAFVARNQSNRGAKEHALEQAAKRLPPGNKLRRPVPIV